MSFAVPIFLFAMLAGLIPVLLHLINQQKAKTIPFSTLRFLRLGAQKTRRRKYLHDILLLVLRVAALVLIALALAKPTLTQLGRLFGSSDSSAVVIVLDNSASMSTVDVGGSRWESALAATHELMNQLNAGDSVALLLTCGPPRPALERMYQNQEVIRQTLAECQVAEEQADLPSRLRAAEKLLEAADAPNQEIYVITDMQAASWDSTLEAGPSEEQDLPPVVLVDVHREPLPNVSIADVSLQSAGPVAGMPIQATVKLSGDQILDQQRHVELVIDDKVLETSPTITIPSGGGAEHSFNFTIDQPGIHRGIVRLTGDDACMTDNQRFFAISTARSIPVAVVKSGNQPIAYLDDSYYLERALNPVDSGGWAIQTDSLSPNRLATAALPKYAVVFCVNLPAVDRNVAARLRNYARGGGHVVWICGDNVDVDLYNTMNQSVDGELLPVPLAELRESGLGQDEAWQIGWIDAAHPALAAFSQPQSLYQSVSVSTHFSTEAVEEDAVHVLAKLNDGQPLLIERAVGAGSVLLLGTSVHVDWSNLPLRPLFLPLVAKLTFHLADAQATQRQLAAGSPIIASSYDDGRQAFEVTRPDGDMLRISAEENASGMRYTDTYQTGIYQVRPLDDAGQREIAVAVNLDSKEIPGAISSPQTILSTVGEDRLVVCNDPAKIAGTMSELRQGRSLMEFFLVALLVILITEAYVANRRVAQEQPGELRELGSAQPTYRKLPDQIDDLADVASR